MANNAKSMTSRFCLPVTGLIIVVIVSLFALCGYFVQSGLNALHTWETGCAVEDSIGNFFVKHGRFPENWDEINASYLAEGFDTSGYGFPVEHLAETINVNFVFLRRCNLGEENQTLASEQSPWILAQKTGRSHKFEKEFFDRIMLHRRKRPANESSYSTDIPL